ncbi:MAG: phosphoribosylaminoimidazolesuccinocarboxamide synthase [Candidatus Hydrothermarchaeales archaeon]
MEEIYQGKAKTVYDAGEGIAVIEFRDDITAGDGAKKERKEGKGAINAEISARLLNLLEESGIKTHFIEFQKPNRLVVRNVKIIPVEVILRNIATGSLVRRYPFKEGEVLDSPVVEFGYKSDEYHDPMLNDEIALALNLCTGEELEYMRNETRKINTVLKDFFLDRGIILVDFKLEFGRTAEGEIVLVDEISPDTCRFWDKETREIMDKDRFRRDMGDVLEFYNEVKRRVLSG